ncbi:GCN5-related N-acetyltransferase [Thalassoporum mexicanum PCC 7367]|uniref:GNAT family N-acetyltransferase n=1 Tax=Thalassoporum mexicanum TaxID=3457544 RepID=UPI00029FCF9D|nr:GNAT family N-acetyltransferase [Pseudanabaena sp. PCC 7367]AFY70091.1 GCN5-related N-acetyltransferase [Pseudanabaena sp. PCC 7367]
MKLTYQSVEFIHIDALVELVGEFHHCDRHPFTTATIRAITELVNDDRLGEAWLIYLEPDQSDNLEDTHKSEEPCNLDDSKTLADLDISYEQSDRSASLDFLDRSAYSPQNYSFSNANERQLASRSVNQPAQPNSGQEIDRAIGYVLITYAFSLTELGRIAVLDEIYLKAPYRGQGIGKQVLVFVENYCQSIGLKSIYLEVRRDNELAQKLYQNMGYTAIPERYAMYKRI